MNNMTPLSGENDSKDTCKHKDWGRYYSFIDYCETKIKNGYIQSQCPKCLKWVFWRKRKKKYER